MTASDDPLEALRREVASNSARVISTPEDFGLRFLSVDELISKAESSQAAREQLTAPRSSKRPRWYAVAASLAAAAAITVAVALPDANDSDLPPASGPSQSAATAKPPSSFDGTRDVLLAAANVTGPATSDINYWYVKSVQTFGSDEIPREIWIGNGRPSLLRQDGFVDRLPPASFPAAGRSVGWRALQRLPTDSEQLERLLARDAAADGRDRRWTIFKAAGDLVAEAPVPPAVRSALWRVLADQPGSGRTNKLRDRVGRQGWTVSMSLTGEGSITYLVDPTSGELLEARHVPGGDRPAWTITFLERRPAKSAPALAGA